jgi:diguanylate cyclase (GGDEF)-like protein
MAIARHHEPEPPAFDLGAVAWLAERLSAVFEGGDVAANRLAAINAGAKLGLAPAAIDSMLSSIPLALQETAAQFHCNVGPQIDVAAALRDTTASLAEVNRRYNELMQHFGGVLQDKERLAGELQEASEKLTTLALNDGLTGLANHRAFQETLMRAVALADRVKAPLSLLIVDADNIKQVNDTYGHKTGDVVLVTLAEMLRASLRVSDLAARVGGDEFAILLPNTDEPGAKVVADRLRAKVAERAIRGPFGEFRVTVSLGVVATRGPGCKGREHALYEAAHKAVAAAKQAGRNRVQVVPS